MDIWKRGIDTSFSYRSLVRAPAGISLCAEPLVIAYDPRRRLKIKIPDIARHQDLFDVHSQGF